MLLFLRSLSCASTESRSPLHFVRVIVCTLLPEPGTTPPTTSRALQLTGSCREKGGEDRIFLPPLLLSCSSFSAMSSKLLRVYPSELKIPYEVKKQRSCCMELTNRTDQYVAFKVKTTNPRKYSVRHACGILLPRSSCNLTVTMQAPMEMLSDHHCKDKFLVQSVVVRDGATMKDFLPELFVKAPGRVIGEFKLRVVYIAANPPSPVPEEEEEDDSSPRSETPTYIRASGEEPSCAEVTAVKSRMDEEKECAIAVEEKLKLQYKMELLEETRSSQQQEGFSLMFVVLVFMSSVFIGHLMNDIMV
ncbi:vesicle-associated protein 1-3-like isoform X2 [Miscanthus floridulus]|uniref:vesicle-associated protein 1-3-like isoform X2 n=1 Tax=Miscanthus floridulus TaxID=154761 RepID=UPI003457D2A7